MKALNLLILTLILTLISLTLKASSCCDKGLVIKFETTQIEQGIPTIELNYTLDTIGVPNNISVDSITYFIVDNEGLIIDGNSFDNNLLGELPAQFQLELSYNTSLPPFFLQEVRMYMHTNHGMFLGIAYLFFTPWGEIEIYSEYTLPNDERSWLSPIDSGEFVRTEVFPSQIPPLPDTSLPICWQEIEGLAYLVPVNCDTSSGEEPEFTRTIRGRAIGQVTYDYFNELGVWQVLNIGRIRVEAWSNFTRIGVGHTDANGNFNFNIDKVIAFLDNQIPVRLVIKTKDDPNHLEVHYNSVLFGANSAHSMSTSNRTFRNSSSSRRDLHFGRVNGGQHRNFHIFHWAKRSLEFSRAELSNMILIPWAKLKIFVPNNSNGNGCYFRRPTWPGTAPSQGKIGLESSWCGLFENTTYHEVGHFLMYNVQQRNWNNITGGPHPNNLNNRHPNMTITEGFADGFSMIIDARFHNDDNESRFYWYDEIHPLNGVGGNILSVNTNPYTAEFIYARSLLDLWDSFQKLSIYGTNIPPTLIDDEDFINGSFVVQDDIELSFERIMRPFYNDINLIEDPVEYYHQLLSMTSDCEDKGAIRRMVEANFQNPTFAGPGVILNINSDAIYSDFTNTHQNDDIQSGSTALGPNPYIYWYNYFKAVRRPVDLNRLSTITGSFNNAINPNFGNDLSDDLVVGDNSTLHFNRNIPVGWVSSNSTLRPPFPSVMQSSLCDMELRVESGSSVIIGDQAVSANAIVRAVNGTRVIFESGSELRINNNSRLVIENDASFVFEDGATIVLDGSEAVLEIDGRLELGANATFTFNGDGYLLTGFENCLGCNSIIGNGNSKIDINGNGKSDLKLVVKENSVFEAGSFISEFNLTNIKVELNADATLSVGNNASFKFNNVSFEGDLTTPFEEIRLLAHPVHEVINVDVKGGKIGLNAPQLTGGVILQLSDVTISECIDGLETDGKGAIMNNCIIENNQRYSWVAKNNGYFDNSKIINSRIDNAAHGVAFISIGGNLIVKNSVFKNIAAIGSISFSGNGILRSSCSDFKNNHIGIRPGHSATLDIDNSASNLFEDNLVAIQSLGARRLDLDGGKNAFFWDPSLSAYSGGWVPIAMWHIQYNSIVTTPQNLAVNDNLWNANGGPSASDHNLKARWTDPTNPTVFVEQPITLIDNSPNSFFARECLEQIPFDPCPEPPCLFGILSYPCPNCPLVNSPNFINTPTNDALVEVLSYLDSESPNFLLAFDQLEEIINTPLTIGIDANSDYVEEYAFKTIREVYSMALDEGLIDHHSPTNEHLDRIENLILANANPTTSNDTLYNREKVYYTIQHAQLKQSTGNYQEAISIFSSIKPFAANTDLDYINYLECNAMLIKDFLDSLITYETYRIGSEDCGEFLNYDVESTQGGESSSPNMLVNIYPNPTNGQFTFEIEEQGLNFLNVSIFNSSNQLIFSQDYYPSSGQFNQQIDISGTTNGLYNIRFTTNNSVITRSLVIQ